MSLFGRQRRELGALTPEMLVGMRTQARVATDPAGMGDEQAMRHDAVWACLRLRADLISTLPVDVFRRVGGVLVEMPKPPLLSMPGGERVGLLEWLYSSQIDLDRAGNAIGLITERNALGLPARVELQPLSEVGVRLKDRVLEYRIGGKRQDTDNIWHEKQFTMSGLPVGLSPIAYAAWTVSEYTSIRQFLIDWFGGGAMPSAHLRNKERTIRPREAYITKERFRGTVTAGDVFVTGNDWELHPIRSEQRGLEWIQAQQFGITAISRFFGCPADLVDGAVSGQAVTYANIGQRNLQFLIMNLGPAIVRREDALSRALPVPRQVKFNTAALLRMDPGSRAEMIARQIASRTLTVSEARALENLPPLTGAQIQEFEELFGPAGTQMPLTAPKTPIIAGVLSGDAMMLPAGPRGRSGDGVRD